METAPAHSKHSSMSVAMITAKDTQSFPAPGAPTFGGPCQNSRARPSHRRQELKTNHFTTSNWGRAAPPSPPCHSSLLCLPLPLRSSRGPGGHGSCPSAHGALGFIPNVTSTRGAIPGPLLMGCAAHGRLLGHRQSPGIAVCKNKCFKRLCRGEGSGLVHFFSVTKMEKAP